MTRLAPLILLLASAAILAAALLSQYWGGLQPCELCLYERWPYDAAMALALVALVVGRRGVSRAAMAVAVLIFLASAALAFYHAGVERHWFAGPSACTGPALDMSSAAALRAQLLATPPVRCDAVQWAFHGLSLAGLNVLASLLLALFALLAATRLRRTA